MPESGSETQRHPHTPALRGCLILGATLFIASLLFVVNGVVIGMVYAQISPNGPPWLREAKVAQILMFVGPIVLLVVQWWIFDFVSDRVARLGRRK